MMIREDFLIENNQEIKIKPEDIKAGQVIRVTLHNGRGVYFQDVRFLTLTDAYREKVELPFHSIIKGWKVEAKIPPSSEVWHIPL